MIYSRNTFDLRQQPVTACSMFTFLSTGQPWSRATRPKARGLTQHGGPPGWLEESGPADGVILYVMDDPCRLP
jgi:hypothetical protein